MDRRGTRRLAKAHRSWRSSISSGNTAEELLYLSCIPLRCWNTAGFILLALLVDSESFDRHKLAWNLEK